jgi:hypothetical protein
VNLLVLLMSFSGFAIGCFWAWNGHEPAVAWLAILFCGGCAVVGGWDLLHAKLPAVAKRRFDPYSSVEPFVIRRNVLHHLVYAIGSACFAAAGAVLITSGKAPIAGGVSLLFFGPGSLVLIWHVVDPRPRLVIDDEGIDDRMLGVGRIAWSDIESAYVRPVEGSDMICLIMSDPEVYLDRLSPYRHRLARADGDQGFAELNLDLAGAPVATDDVLALINAYIEERSVGAGGQEPGRQADG